MKKSTIIVIVVLVVAAAAYFYLEGSPSSSSSSSLDQQQTDMGTLGTQVLSLLNQTRSLKIDTTLFSDPGYKTLQDYTVDVPQVGVGRANPFAPLPGETTQSSSVGTAGN
jgi:hypothetical protein